jgi:hypothetical protein
MGHTPTGPAAPTRSFVPGPAKRSPNAPRHDVFFFATDRYRPSDGIDERRFACLNLEPPFRIINTDGSITVIPAGPNYDPFRDKARDRSLDEIQGARDFPYVSYMDADGVPYLTRRIDRYILFRPPDRQVAEDALFTQDTTPAGFAQAIRTRAAGRCLLHVPPCMKHEVPVSVFKDHGIHGAGLGIYLFFEPDGTGFALHHDLRRDKAPYNWLIAIERIDFRWDSLNSGITDILTAPLEQVRALCDPIFEDQVASRMQDGFFDPVNLLDVPATWESGSEEELRLLARAVCITEPGIFDNNEPVTAVFKSSIDGKRGGFLKVTRDEEYDQHLVISPRIVALSELAYRLNSFSGVRWAADFGGTRRKQKSAMRLKIRVEPPSAHEKAEAYLTLIDWLDDKLYDSEKRARCGLPPCAHTVE